MSTEKPESQQLVLPERSQIVMTDRGFEIINDGDIIVRAKVAVGSLRSLNGDIHLLPPPGEKQIISSVEAPNGMIRIIGDEFEIMEIRAKEVFCDMRSLTSKVIRADEDITLNRGRLQVNAVSARSIHFDGTDFSASHVGVQEELEFRAENVHSQVITGDRVKFYVRGTVRAGKLTAHSMADIEAKSVDINYLSAKNVRIEPQTQGVIVCLDGAAPSEPNSIVGMLSPSILMEKFSSLSGLIQEMQSGQPERALPPPVEVKVAADPVIEVVANGSNGKSEMLPEKPPEFYRTSAEIPIPYRNLAEKHGINIEKSPAAAEPDESTEPIAEPPRFEPDLTPTGPLFEPNLTPSGPLFEPTFEPAPAASSGPIFEPPVNNNEPEVAEAAPAVSAAPVAADEVFSVDHNPLDLPPLTGELDVTNVESNPLSLTSDGAVDLGFDMKDHPKSE